MVSMKISINENNGIINTGNYVQNSFTNSFYENLKWDDIDNELNKLLEITNSSALKEFAYDSKRAVKQRNYNKLFSVASKIGKFGLEFLKEASLNILAEIVTKSLYL